MKLQPISNIILPAQYTGYGFPGVDHSYWMIVNVQDTGEWHIAVRNWGKWRLTTYRSDLLPFFLIGVRPFWSPILERSGSTLEDWIVQIHRHVVANVLSG